MRVNVDSERIVGLAVSQRRAPLSGSRYANYTDLDWMIREAITQFGLGRSDPERPLSDIVQPGMTVLLKPNWVLHYNASGQGMECMITHPAFVRAVLEQVLAARPGKVIIGDAPIQSCRFDSIASAGWREQVSSLGACPVEVMDLRRVRLTQERLEQGKIEELRGPARYVLFDLGRASLLDPISSPGGRFRVTNYDPAVLANTHRSGHHQYMIAREAFEADVILNLPKLKTHGKTGITGALKNAVGFNGHKDFLPHHRLGGSTTGGDCYAGLAPLKRVTELCFDIANRRIGTTSYSRWVHLGNTVLGWQARFGDVEIEGSWYGNDTAWRMALDLNRIVIFGQSNGTLAERPLRKIYSLTDALVAGQGNGPLSPRPCDLGVVSFAASSAHADLVHAALMHFDWQKIPLIAQSFRQFKYPITTSGPEEVVVRVKGTSLSLAQSASELGHPFRAHDGWAGHIEISPRTQ